MDAKLLFYKLLILIGFMICLTKSEEFKVYWNIPTFMCKKYDMPFDTLPGQYGIIQNQNDSFRGNQIAILYDPGNFPAILQNTSSKEYFYRNHGVPQSGNLSDHLEHLKQQINELIPDYNFSGVAVLDFESWRPIFRQNFGTLLPYKTLSRQIEQRWHPSWSKRQIEREATTKFEAGGKTFMLSTLKLAKMLRPNAKWGYYAFPYCFNGNGMTPDQCAKGVWEENNMIQWMFQASGAIFPSVYLQERLPQENRIPMVRGRVREALRVAYMVNSINRPNVLAYHRYVYSDTLKYMDTPETFNVLKEIKDQGADGVILWGSSFDLNTRTKCQQFQTYLEEKLGPAIRLLKSI